VIWVKNTWFPFGNYRAITLWPFVFYKGGVGSVMLNHELIHGRQQVELLVIPFYVIYVIEWLFKGYRGISFEREAYEHEDDFKYLRNRKFWGMWR